PTPFSLFAKRLSVGSSLALRELEAAASLGAAVLLTLDDARVAGQEALGLDRGAQRRLIFGQRLRDAVLDGAGLPREAATLDRADHVILAGPLGDRERLVDDEAQRRAREIDFLIAAIDRDLAGAGLHPDACDGVLAAAGRISAALLVQLLLAERRVGDGRLRRGDSDITLREVLQIGQRVDGIRHQAPTLFLRFIAA